MKTESKFLVAVGLILIAMAGIGLYGVYHNPEAILPDDPIVPNVPGPVYFPAEGTEDFAFGEAPNEWTPAGTGIYESLGQTFYGTLWKHEDGAWMIVEPNGQIPIGGSTSACIPEAK